MVDFAMAHLSGTDRSQLLLLPEAIDDYGGPNNPVRFIEACRQLDLFGWELLAVDGTRIPEYGTARMTMSPAGAAPYVSVTTADAR